MLLNSFLFYFTFIAQIPLIKIPIVARLMQATFWDFEKRFQTEMKVISEIWIFLELIDICKNKK